jgi:uncharacterized protein YjiS (DUF1127 family)
MLALASIPAAVASARRASKRSSRTRAAVAALDRRTLADIGICPGEILSVAQDIGLDRLRCPPHV